MHITIFIHFLLSKDILYMFDYCRLIFIKQLHHLHLRQSYGFILHPNPDADGFIGLCDYFPKATLRSAIGLRGYCPPFRSLKT